MMNKIKIYTYKILNNPLCMLAASILVIILVRGIIYPTIIYAEEINTGYLLKPDMKQDASGEYYFELTTKNTVLFCGAILGFVMLIGYLGSIDFTALIGATPIPKPPIIPDP